MPATDEQLTAWAASCLHMNHHGTLIGRALDAGDITRARELAERARARAWVMFNEMVAVGASKPEGYREPDPFPVGMRGGIADRISKPGRATTSVKL